MKTRFLIAIVTLLSVSAFDASAQKNRNLSDESQRIHQGVKSGELTASEAARLNTQKAHLRNESIRYKTNDGCIRPRERADLRRDKKRLDKNIFRQKHDRQRRC